MSVVRMKLILKDRKTSLKNTKLPFMSIPLLRESYHIKQRKMKSFQLNPISSRSEDDTKHAEQDHSPENSLEVIL